MSEENLLFCSDFIHKNRIPKNQIHIPKGCKNHEEKQIKIQMRFGNNPLTCITSCNAVKQKGNSKTCPYLNIFLQ